MAAETTDPRSELEIASAEVEVGACPICREGRLQRDIHTWQVAVRRCSKCGHRVATHELTEITEDYQGRAPLLVGVLKGAFMFMSDLARAVALPVEFDFMAVSSYGSAGHAVRDTAGRSFGISYAPCVRRRSG